MTVALNPFSAEHQYFPDWFLLAENLRISPEPTVIPSLVHVIFGVGLPVAMHWKVASSDSRTVWLLGAVVRLGATATKKISCDTLKG